MSVQYQLVKVDDLWCCLQQSPARWLALWLSQEDILRRPPFYLDRLLMLRILKRLLLHRLRRLQNADILHMRRFGQLCVPVRRGFKVFDLQGKIVTKVFPTSSDKTTFMEELERVRRASALGLGPAVRNWNIHEHWYEEDFIYGYPAYSPYSTFDATFMQLYQPQIVTYLERMILVDPPHRIAIGEYLDEMTATLERTLFTQRLVPEKLRAIKLFAEAIVQQLRKVGDQDISLIFSHGDFSRNNLVITQQRVVVSLDWQYAFRRSPLHDLYWYFLLELSDGHIMLSNATKLINDAILLLQHRLSSSVPALAKTLTLKANVYRLLFYLEVLVRCSKDPREGDGEILAHHTQVFTRYEEELRK